MTTSAVYEGWVAHRRAGVVPHSFGYRVFMPLFDLEELPGLLDGIPLWSARRPAPARFRDGDYLPGDGDSLAERARNLVDARLGRRPAGPVRLLANPRYLGVGFNPVSFLFLHTPDGGLDSVIAEVTNTPWAERTAYVLDWDGHAGDEPITCSFEKGMHVSPFQSMEQTYEISVTRPGQRLGVVIRNHEGGREVFVASMALRRSEVTRTRMLAAAAPVSADDRRDARADLRERAATQASWSPVPSPSGGERTTALGSESGRRYLPRTFRRLLQLEDRPALHPSGARSKEGVLDDHGTVVRSRVGG